MWPTPFHNSSYPMTPQISGEARMSTGIWDFLTISPVMSQGSRISTVEISKSPQKRQGERWTVSRLTRVNLPAPVIDPLHRPSGMCARSVKIDASPRFSLPCSCYFRTGRWMAGRDGSRWVEAQSSKGWHPSSSLCSYDTVLPRDFYLDFLNLTLVMFLRPVVFTQPSKIV
jgi:hypothetical protein